MTRARILRRFSGLTAALAGLALLVIPVAEAATPLIGTFRIAPGSCSAGVSGSYFRMILPTGGPGGPYVANENSTCSDQTFTLLAPGTDGGLVVGSFQPEPTPPFDGAGNSRSERIARPAPFFGVDFALSTNPKDPQAGGATPPPAITHDGAGHLSGNLSAFTASWNNQEFNQGSPKPDGSHPGNTVDPSGTYDPATGAFTLEWTSQIVGGPFNNFSGQWHLVGTFVSSGTAPARTPAANTTPTPATTVALTASPTTTVVTAPAAAPATTVPLESSPPPPPPPATDGTELAAAAIS